MHTTLNPGWFYAIDDTATVNFSEVVTPDGLSTDRYDKVRTVPFGEFVPLRGFLEALGVTGLPPRDSAGMEPAVLDTPFGRVGVSISWEIFFDHHARDTIGNGGQGDSSSTPRTARSTGSRWCRPNRSHRHACGRSRPAGGSCGRAHGVLRRDRTRRHRATAHAHRPATRAVRHRRAPRRADHRHRVGVWPMLLASLALVAAAHTLDRRGRRVRFAGASVTERGADAEPSDSDEHRGSDQRGSNSPRLRGHAATTGLGLLIVEAIRPTLHEVDHRGPLGCRFAVGLVRHARSCSGSPTAPLPSSSSYPATRRAPARTRHRGTT